MILVLRLHSLIKAIVLSLILQFQIVKKKKILIFMIDRKSTRLNSSHVSISYAVFCLKKKDPRARRRVSGTAAAGGQRRGRRTRRRGERRRPRPPARPAAHSGGNPRGRGGVGGGGVRR